MYQLKNISKNLQKSDFYYQHFDGENRLIYRARLIMKIVQNKGGGKEVRKVLAALSEGYRDILRLKYLEGLTVNQIAKKLKTSFKAVESRLSRARGAFRKIWLTKSEC